MSEADDSDLEVASDALMERLAPEMHATMMRARAAQASISAPKPPNPEPPTLVVSLIAPESMKRPEERETAVASLASLAYAAAITAYQKALGSTNPAIADAYLTQGARQSLTVTALVDALNSASKPPKRTVPVRSSRETWNAYHRDLMRKRAALRRLDA